MGRRALLIVAVAALAAVLPGPAAGAETEFTFYGMGWGHGLGTSQWGAYGLALKGWSAERIVRHFYTGTAVKAAPTKPSRIRVGLLQDRKHVHVTAESGKVELRLGQPNTGQLVEAIPDGATWTVEVQDGKYRISDANGELVGGKLWGGSWKHLFARYAPLGSRARVAEAGHTYNRGWLEFNLYPTGCGACADKMRLVADVPTKQYFYGIAEVPSSWPQAALRAQALAARTYAFEKIDRLGQHRDGCNCGLYGSTQDQVYAGWDKEGGVDGDRWVRAVEDTAGRAVLNQGAYIQAFYHSSSGGFTENNENVWGGEPLPYLRGVCDPGDWTAANPNRVWELTMSGWQAGNKVSAYTGQDIGNVTGFTGIVRGVSGRITTVTVEGTTGSVTLSGTALRSALGLKDSRVWIDQDRTVTGAIRERYDALDCRPGQPASPEAWVQGGHRQRFADGAIYHNHAREVARWLRGPVLDKYVALGEATSLLGLPRTGVEAMPKLGGRRARFEGGFIYHQESAGAHELHGPVLEHFRSHGGASHFGFPVTDVNVKPNGAQWAEFQKGKRIVCPAGGGACRVVDA